jgi:hypothetical protein
MSKVPKVGKKKKVEYRRQQTEDRMKRQDNNHEDTKIDAFVKSPKRPVSVIPAEAGIQEYQGLLDPGFRRGDGLEDFLRTHQS